MVDRPTSRQSGAHSVMRDACEHLIEALEKAIDAATERRQRLRYRGFLDTVRATHAEVLSWASSSPPDAARNAAIEKILEIRGRFDRESVPPISSDPESGEISSVEGDDERSDAS